MPENTIQITDANFEKVTNQGVALVDFWAERCPPCRLQGPIVDKIADDFAGRATVGKLDVDSNPRVPSDFSLMYIPTLIIFRDGQEVARLTGLQQEEILVSEIEKALNST